MNYIQKTTAIKSWAEEDRPREKLILKGKTVLSNAELLAILIGSGSTSETAVELSKRILLTAENNLQELSKFNLEELTEFKGVGEAKAVSIMAAMELGRRYRSEEAMNRKRIKSSHDAYDAVFSYFSDLNYEEFYIILLNRANDILGIHRISAGGTSGTVVDPKKIFKLALIKHASGIILCHNHPSGNMQASMQDKMLTNKIKKSAELLEFALLDHIIVGQNKFYSFADEAIL